MSKNIYPLLSNAFNKKDIDCGINVLKSKFITMSKHTLNFEKSFAKKMNAKFALMTNSGSSANLLALSALINPLRHKRLRSQDEVLIPAVCWSTSLWPIIQNNLKPVFVDVNTNDFNISIEDLKKKITKKTKAIMCIHILGTSTNMTEVMKLAKKNDIEVIEDTCESLGAKFKNKYLGNFGNFGTYSFYYSHQITSGEGGMIVCKSKDDYNLLKMLRSHGWSRGIDVNKHLKKNFIKIDKRFLFINSGYNLRPTDIQAAIANNQFKRLKSFMKNRNVNRNKIIKSLHSNLNWRDQFKFVEIDHNIKPSWFGLPFMLNENLIDKKEKILKFLSSKGIENRPILSGNFLNQPAAKTYNLNKANLNFKNADEVEKRGFFIGLHTTRISKKDLDFLTLNLLKIDKI